MRKILITLCIAFVLVACEKQDAANSREDKILTCGSSLTAPFQCISAAGKSTLTTTKIPELYGYWDSDDFDFCVNYKSDGTGTITFKPSGLSKGSTQKIKWGAMVNSKGELVLSNAGTIYIAHESLEGSLDPQIALMSFKQSTKQWWGFDLRSVSSCPTVSGGGTPGTGGNGNIIFYTKSDLGCGSIKVTINGQTGTINQYFSSGAPACGNNGGANFSLPAGNYTFTAECTNYKWTSTPVTITAGQCFKMELK
ncbi:carboxypeptidase-like regulatory domain-containing protein [Daejeonella sp. JGW-45]|uniref:carboxypeptidase-like regulatory domain-containing protein n=1 Tax=Daejeonella sp. JGW-45 TaxID=3034148 RepID=UPI0023EAD355|nr:carboxypeptidase-like regulatory domain-containing protein [Daejeonella sp. JGW-45]